MFSPLELIGYLVIVTALAGTLGYRWAVSQLEPKLRKAQQGLARADQTGRIMVAARQALTTVAMTERMASDGLDPDQITEVLSVPPARLVEVDEAGTGRRTTAFVISFVLYLLLLVMPVTGWMLTSAAEHPVAFFGLFELPAIVGPDHDLHESLEDVHEALFNAIAAIAVLHALAAVYHHVWMKDDTLRRMLPFGK